MADIIKLAETAVPINDEEWGSERQTDAENAFWDEACRVGGKKGVDLTPESDFGNWCLKANTEDMINEALRLLNIDHTVDHAPNA